MQSQGKSALGHQLAEALDRAHRARSRVDRVALGADHAVGGRPQVETGIEVEGGAGIVQAGSGVVVAADTTVVAGDEVLGKPASLDEALAMWRRLSGCSHQVLTGVAVGNAGRVEVQVVVTEVRFRAMAEAEMRAYWASGEPADKAGGYAIQGLGAIFVAGIAGSYSNVVGLPLAETAAMLASFGIRVLDVENR